MGNLWKYIAIIVILGLWIFIVGRSCNKSKISGTTADITNSISGEEPGGDTDLEDLYEVDENDVAEGDADASSNGENLPNNANAADDMEMDGDDPDVGAVDETDETANGSSSTSSNSNNASNGSTFGKYLVVTGSYLSEPNAKLMAKKLRNMGYDAAEVYSFDISQYYSVTAGRYTDLAEARTVARKVKAKGIEAYVHKMRGKKVGR